MYKDGNLHTHQHTHKAMMGTHWSRLTLHILTEMTFQKVTHCTQRAIAIECTAFEGTQKIVSVGGNVSEEYSKTPVGLGHRNRHGANFQESASESRKQKLKLFLRKASINYPLAS